MKEHQLEARDIIIKMQYQEKPLLFEQAKKCSLIAVDKIIEAIPKYTPLNGFGSALFDNPDIEYWKEVKQEIEKL